MGLLMVLVVVGHAIEPISGRVPESMLQWITLFHMPAFVFMSGYVTRWASRTSVSALARRLLFPFAVFVVLHVAVRAVASGEALHLDVWVPPWTLWYLPALFAWRLAAPWMRRVPGVVVITTCAALLAGTVDGIGQELSLSRIVAFAPFFAAGLMWKDEWWSRLRARRARWTAVVVLGGAALWSWAAAPAVDRSRFFLRESYGDAGVWDAAGIVQRAAILAVGAALTLAVLSLVHRPVPALARIGAASLPVYLLHPLVLYPSHLHGYPEAVPAMALLVGLIAASIGFAWLAASPAVVRGTRPLMDLSWWTSRSQSAAR